MGNARRQRGFVNPEWLILIALFCIGIALATPIIEPLLHDKPISVWHWAGLGVGGALVAGCIAWIIKTR